MTVDADGDEPDGRRLRLVGVADTDSYVKWAAALLGTAPAGWDAALLVLSTPVTVSDAQLAAALAGSGLDAVTRTTYDELVARLEADRPDAVLVATRGPLARVVARAVAEAAPGAVIVTGLPGISIPATRKALTFRAQCDLFVVHSHRETREFAALAEVLGLRQTFALSSLPFAANARPPANARHAADVRPVAGAHQATDAASAGGDLVFAAQAVVPLDRGDRRRIVALLVRAAQAHPERRVVLKVRAAAGEHQTHAEADPYPDLLAEMGPAPANLVVEATSMRTALDTAEGLVTVSSTAAIEALARGIPVIALDTFGVSPELINVVFEGSGLFGGEDDVVARRFRHPHPSWIRDNYLHDASDDDWAHVVADLVARRRAESLPPRPPFARPGGRLRDVWERKRVLGPLDRTFAGHAALVVGLPLRAVVVAAQRVYRRVTGETPRPGPEAAVVTTAP